MVNKIDGNLNSNILRQMSTVTNVSDPVTAVNVSFFANPQSGADQSNRLEKFDKQLDIVFKNAKSKLEHIPPPFSLMGASKIKNDASKIMDDPKFRVGVINILENTAQQPGNENKNIVELARDKTTYKKLLDYIRQSAKDSSTLSFILNSSIVESKLYDYIKSDKIMSFLTEA